MAADSPEFGQFSEKSPCGHVADARNGFQERLGFAPSWGMLDGVADVVVDRVELLLEIGDVAREPSGERLGDGLAALFGFHAYHLGERHGTHPGPPSHRQASRPKARAPR